MTRPLLALGLLWLVAACSSESAPAATGDESGEPPAEAATVAPPQSKPPAPADEAPPTGELPRVSISAVGDCTLGGQYEVRLAPGSFHHEMDRIGHDYRVPFSGVLDVTSADDLTIANLEGPLADLPSRTDRIAFVGDPRFVDVLVQGSVEVVNLANNHADDTGQKGAAQTRRVLEEAGVGFFGDDFVDVRTIHGIEVVNLGYLGGSLDAQARAERAIRDHKRDDNLVIVSFHWGIEEVTATNTIQRKLGRAAVDAGADLVLGHHPHVLQGIEVYHGARIVYSLGNFVFGGHSDPEDTDSVIYRTSFVKDGGRVRFDDEQIVPVSVTSAADRNDFRPRLLVGAERQRVLERIAEYSSKL